MVHELLGAFHWARGRRLFSGMFVAGFLLAVAGDLVEGPSIGLRAAIGVGVMFALIPVVAMLVALVRAFAGFVLASALVALFSLLRAAYSRWSSWRDSAVVEQLMARSYGRSRPDR